MNFSPQIKGRSLPIYVIPLAIVLLVIVVLVLMALNKNTNQANKSTSNQTTLANEYDFKNLGVAISLPSELKGMTSTPLKSGSNTKGTPPPIVKLELESYNLLANACTKTVNKSYPFAYLIKMNANSGGGDSTILKKFKSFEIAEIAPGVPKNNKCLDVSKQQQFDSLKNALTSALRSAFSTAQAIE